MTTKTERHPLSSLRYDIVLSGGIWSLYRHETRSGTATVTRISLNAGDMWMQYRGITQGEEHRLRVVWWLAIRLAQMDPSEGDWATWTPEGSSTPIEIEIDERGPLWTA